MIESSLQITLPPRVPQGTTKFPSFPKRSLIELNFVSLLLGRGGRAFFAFLAGSFQALAKFIDQWTV